MRQFSLKTKHVLSSAEKESRRKIRNGSIETKKSLIECLDFCLRQPQQSAGKLFFIAFIL